MVQLSVNIDVDDLAAGERFYTEAFGLSVARRFGPHAVELVGGSARVYLLAKAAGTLPFAGATLTRDYARHWTPVHLDFLVEDLDAALARAVAAGARHEGEIVERAWGRMAFCADPFGHGFCVLQMKGRGYDELTTG